MATIIASGEWWALDSDGVLNVFCVGDMPSIPWGDYSDQIVSVILSDSVTGIAQGAFEDCFSLTSVTIPNSVASIGSYAFFECSGLTSVTIPDGVVSISEGTFCRCSSLTSVTIPDSVTTIGDSAFEESGLSSIDIPNTVTSIGEYAFSWCNLTSVQWPPEATTIRYGAFYFDNSLESVTIPSSVTSIEISAFAGCEALTDVYYTGTEQQWNAITIDGDNDYLTGATIHCNYAPPEPDPEPEPAPDPNLPTPTPYNPDPSQWPSVGSLLQWPYSAQRVMEEIAGRIGTPIDPRTVIDGSIEDTALGMTMREVAGYIAAQNGGNWTITDEGKLYLVPLGAALQSEAAISAHNAESLSVSDPLEPWSGVRVIWDGDEWDAGDAYSGDVSRPVKRGDEIGYAPNDQTQRESGRVLEIKVAFGQSATVDPSTMWNRGAQNILAQIQGNAYYPFDAVNVVLDPACEIGDAVTIPGGTSCICSMSGELDGVCAIDASAPPDEAINTAYPANWQKVSSGARVTSAEVEQIVTDAWDAAFSEGGD